MVSRRRILSRSRDDLNLDSTFVMQEEEEDVWYQRDKLYKVSRPGHSVVMESSTHAWNILYQQDKLYKVNRPRHW
jgi:hypothetical protein